MLILRRRVHEAIAISDNIRITVLRIHGDRVRLGVEAPANFAVFREELLGPADPGLEAGGPPIAGSSEGQGTDGDPPPGRSRGGAHQGQGLRSPRSPEARPLVGSREGPHRQRSRGPRRRDS